MVAVFERASIGVVKDAPSASQDGFLVEDKLHIVYFTGYGQFDHVIPSDWLNAS